MFDFHEKRKIKSWLFSKVSVFILLVLTALLGTSVFERYQKERETAHNHYERAAELERLRSQAAALEAKVSYAESERGIEEEIRDRYDVVKEGERAVIIVDAPREETARPAPVDDADLSDETTPSFFSWIFFWR